MKYIKGLDYQVCVKYKGELIATMYFQRLEDAENYYNKMFEMVVLHKDATISLNNYILQYTAETEYECN